jgi:hypothetical protein
MNLDKLITALKEEKYSVINEEELQELLFHSQNLIEKETYISGKIRLLKVNDELIIQEKSDKDELIIRPVKTIEEAEELIKQRLEIYEKMWDGCGCKVDYYK